MTRLLIALLALAVSQATGLLGGVVVDSVTQLPVAGAQILLVPEGGAPVSAVVSTTTDRGEFAFRGLAAGRYRAVVTRDGYLRHAQNGFTVAANDAASGRLTIALMPTGVVIGRVTSEFGDPAPKIYIRAWSSTSLVAETRTNDLGEYRLFGLAPGRYVVSAERYQSPYFENGRYTVPTPPCPDCPGEGRGMMAVANVTRAGEFVDLLALTRESYPPVYFPGTTERAQAAEIEVGPGREVPGIDLRLVRRMP